MKMVYQMDLTMNFILDKFILMFLICLLFWFLNFEQVKQYEALQQKELSIENFQSLLKNFSESVIVKKEN